MNRKFLALFLIILFMFSNFEVSAQTNALNSTVQSAKSLFQNDIKEEINDAITQIYGEIYAPEISKKVFEIAQKAIEERPTKLKTEDLKRPDDWYKDEIIYMFYVDQFGTITPEKPNQFKDTAEMFDYLKDLGVTTLYLLPFAESPMSDAGFDVKNPQNIRKDLGGTPQFKEFIKLAKENKFKIKSDLVLNHFSDQHEWFQELLKGDLTKLNYFIVCL